LAEALKGYEPSDEPHEFWDRDAPQSMLIEEVEAIWNQIDNYDDWSSLETKLKHLNELGAALGNAPQAAGLSTCLGK
jgi:hypothetical protein